jgi:hypothetical protein
MRPRPDDRAADPRDGHSEEPMSSPDTDACPDRADDLPDHTPVPRQALGPADIVNPGWEPVCISTLTEDIPRYIEAPATALTDLWKHFLGGHLGRLGAREAVETVEARRRIVLAERPVQA